jgi:hypothetical protein
MFKILRIINKKTKLFKDIVISEYSIQDLNDIVSFYENNEKFKIERLS